MQVQLLDGSAPLGGPTFPLGIAVEIQSPRLAGRILRLTEVQDGLRLELYSEAQIAAERSGHGSLTPAHYDCVVRADGFRLPQAAR